MHIINEIDTNWFIFLGALGTTPSPECHSGKLNGEESLSASYGQYAGPKPGSAGEPSCFFR